MNKVQVSIQVLDHGKDLPLPAYETSDSAGMDLRAAVMDPVEIAVGDVMLVPTGLKIALPSGYEAQVRPRSGLALKKGVTIPNSPGTVDADYRGEVGVILQNLGKDVFRIQRGDRIAQMVIAPVTQATWLQQTDLSETDRGTGGFGSTGVSG